MTIKPTIRKSSARFMREADKRAIDRVNQAVPEAGMATKVDRALAARITAIRRNIGIVPEKTQLDAAVTVSP